MKGACIRMKSRKESVVFKVGHIFSVLLSFTVICALMFQPASLTASSPGQSDNKEHDKIVEEVTVTNVQVPVRVIHNGQPVTDLKLEDFTLYEGKKKVKINGFFLKRKTMDMVSTAPADAGTPAAAGNPEPGALPRTFVLVFNVVNYNKYFQEAMDHLFDNFLRVNDRLLILANNTTKEYKRLSDKASVKKQMVEVLKKESRDANRRLLNYIKQVENVLESHPFHRLNFATLGSGTGSQQVEDMIIQYLTKYLGIWSQYQRRYLTPDLSKFYYFSRYLENIKTDKWVLNFYQFEMFPRIRISSRTMNKLRDFTQLLRQSDDGGKEAQAKVIDQLLQRVALEIDITKTVPNDEISKLFYKVDATFHSFFYTVVQYRIFAGHGVSACFFQC